MNTMKRWVYGSQWLLAVVLIIGSSITAFGDNFSLKVEDQEVCFSNGAATFLLTAHPDRNIVVREGQKNCNAVPALTIRKPASPGVKAWEWDEIKILSDNETVKKVCAVYKNLRSPGQQQPPYVEKNMELKLSLEMVKGLPCLFVEFEVVNVSNLFTTNYCVWGYHSSNSEAKEYKYILPSGEYVFSKPYGLAVGDPPEWVMLPWGADSKGGMVVVMRDVRLMETADKGFFAIYGNAILEEGASFGGKFVLFPAKDAAEANSIFGRLKKYEEEKKEAEKSKSKP